MSITYKDDDRGPIGIPAYLAVQDAQARNQANHDNFTQKEHQFADAFLVKCQLAWFRSRCYINYREKYIAVKVAKPTSQDRVSQLVADLEQFCLDNNIEPRKTNTGLIYHLPRLSAKKTTANQRLKTVDKPTKR